MNEKNEIRKICKRNRSSLNMDEVRDRSAMICSYLMNHPKVQQAGQVLVYSAIHKEADLHQLVEQLWETGKSVAFPRVLEQGGLCAENPGKPSIMANHVKHSEETGKNSPVTVTDHVEPVGNDMEFYEVTGWNQLISGAYGILEPRKSLVPIIPQKDAVICVPGVAFSVDGSRIGMGRGYYDRYLSRYPYLYKIGVAYELQMGYNWETDPLDVPMDAIVTEVRL